MKQVLSILVLFCGLNVLADGAGGKGGSDIGSSNLDTYFRALSETKEIEMNTLHLPKSENGSLTHIYSCVTARIATSAMQIQMMNQFKQGTIEAFKSLPFGEKLLDKMLEQEPGLLDLNIENLPYAQACQAEIKAAQDDQRISSETLAKVIRLSELGGTFLSQYMTQK